MNIKARLQFLRNNGQPTGMPNQAGIPVPQDIHPQQYQAPGVGAPPGGLHWAPPSSSASQVAVAASSAPSAGSQDWRTRLADMQHQQPAQPAPQAPHERREAARPIQSQRPHSPRVEQLRQIPEPGREPPVRRPSPPQMAFPNSQALPQPQPSAPQANAANRFPNPGYAGSDPAARFHPAGPPGAAIHGAPYGRGNSPAPEIKPLADAMPSSPSALSGPPQYQPNAQHASQAGIAAGGPPPTAALAAAEAAAARERDERPVAGVKRTLESDEESQMPNKYPANGEHRSRFEDSRRRRASPPNRRASPTQHPISPRTMSPRGRPASPSIQKSRGSSPSRREDQQRPDQNPRLASTAPTVTHPAPPSLPASQNQTAETPVKAAVPAKPEPQDDDKEAFEAAARKMDVDENYDDEGEEEEKKTKKKAEPDGVSPQAPRSNPTTSEVAAEA